MDVVKLFTQNLSVHLLLIFLYPCGELSKLGDVFFNKFALFYDGCASYGLATRLLHHLHIHTYMHICVDIDY